MEAFLAWVNAMMISKGTYSDVIEVSSLLQCLGYSVKSLQVLDGNASQGAGGATTITINCPTSGYNVVLENTLISCSCPAPVNDLSGLWSVTGVAQGKAAPQESGHGLIGTVPKEQRDRLAEELHQMIRRILDQNVSVTTSQHELSKSASTSMLEMTSPEKKIYQLKVESPMSPVRYRSLDTLTRMDGGLPQPGVLTKGPAAKARRMVVRQDTYTVRRPISVASNKTSSPIKSSSNLLEHVLEADKAAIEMDTIHSKLRQKLSLVISELTEPRVDADVSMASLSLDMSKISVQQSEPAKCQFASSPNLSGLLRDDMRSSLKLTESASTSNLGVTKAGEPKKMSRLRRLSPNFFKGMKMGQKDSKSQPNTPSNNGQDGKSKLQNIFKPRIVTPVTNPHRESNASVTNFSSANKKKYSHVKSTIPRPTPSPTLPRKGTN